jgi:hypothetical protein
MESPHQSTSREVDRGAGPIQQMTQLRLAETLRTHTPQGPWPIHGSSPVHATGDEACFGAQQTRTSGPGHSQRGERTKKRQQTWCRTGDRSDDVPPPGEPGERPNGSGCGRSSAEAVTALGPTRLQHGASSAGAHACTKPVLAGLASVVGLKGALHGASCGDKLPFGSTRSMWLSCASGTRRKRTTG